MDFTKVKKPSCSMHKPVVRCAGALVLIAGCILCAACMEPGPLYGTWADNRGNTLSLFDDNSFNAQISASAGMPAQNYNGNYSLLANSLTMNCTETGLRIVTEWDIRGNILYLNWVTAEEQSIALTLFKVAD